MVCGHGGGEFVVGLDDLWVFSGLSDSTIPILQKNTKLGGYEALINLKPHSWAFI